MFVDIILCLGFIFFNAFCCLLSHLLLILLSFLLTLPLYNINNCNDSLNRPLTIDAYYSKLLWPLSWEPRKILSIIFNSLYFHCFPYYNYYFDIMYVAVHTIGGNWNVFPSSIVSQRASKWMNTEECVVTLIPGPDSLEAIR